MNLRASRSPPRPFVRVSFAEESILGPLGRIERIMQYKLGAAPETGLMVPGGRTDCAPIRQSLGTRNLFMGTQRDEQRPGVMWSTQ